MFHSRNPTRSFSSALIAKFHTFRFLCVLAVLAVTGCSTISDFNKERFARNNGFGQAWLSDQTLPAEINVSGTWTSDAWGKAVLAQNGRAVAGYIGDYPVEGVVSGRKAYLLGSENRWYYYSIILELPDPNLLIGYYSRSVPYSADHRSDIRLDRVH